MKNTQKLNLKAYTWHLNLDPKGYVWIGGETHTTFSHGCLIIGIRAKSPCDHSFHLQRKEAIKAAPSTSHEQYLVEAAYPSRKQHPDVGSVRRGKHDLNCLQGLHMENPRRGICVLPSQIHLRLPFPFLFLSIYKMYIEI